MPSQPSSILRSTFSYLDRQGGLVESSSQHATCGLVLLTSPARLVKIKMELEAVLELVIDT